MRYAAIVHREGKHTLAEFPDCEGCQAFTKGKVPIERMAQDALTGWLASYLGIPDKKRRPGDVPVLADEVLGFARSLGLDTVPCRTCDPVIDPGCPNCEGFGFVWQGKGATLSRSGLVRLAAMAKPS